MGEDRSVMIEKKPSDTYRVRHSSVMSSCSEDAESESTSGYPPTPDSEELAEELEYGPGIVHKLRTRFLSISLKQTRGASIQRSCSMEDLLEQDCPEVLRVRAPPGQSIGLKRAKSMDTLLADLHNDPIKLLRKDPSRTVQTICDEELPKPDTVKTYKRMFEPAESRRGSYCRRPPVLRASAKSTIASKVLMNPSTKLNGFQNKRFSAKSPVKTPEKNVLPVNGITKKIVLSDETAMQNGGHVVKATPLKISNSTRKGKDMENLNSINNILNKNDMHLLPEKRIICNGNGVYKNNVSPKTVEATINRFNKNVVSQSVGHNSKPKVPPNKPSLKPPVILPKPDDRLIKGRSSPIKLKPVVTNGFKKIENGIANGKCNFIESKFNNRSKSPVENGIKTETKVPSPINISKAVTFSAFNKCDIKPSINKFEKVPIIDNDKKTNIPVVNKLNVEENNKTSNIIDSKSDSNNPSKLTMNMDLPESLPKVGDDLSLVDIRISNELSQPSTNVTEETEQGSIVNGKTDRESPISGKVKKEIKTLFENNKPKAEIKQIPIATKKTIQPPTETSPHDVNPAPDLTNTEEKVVFEESKLTTSTPEKTEPAKPIPENASKNLISKAEDSPLKTVHEPIKRTTSPVAKTEIPRCPDVKPVKKTPPSSSTSMVFDFRGKDVVSHIAVTPAPFGCKPIAKSKKDDDEEDEDTVDYSVPPPCGLMFEGENVKIGRGSILTKRNKELKISFEEDVDSNTFIYPSETSLLEEPETPLSPLGNRPRSPPPSPRIKGQGLSAYTPSVLRTVENFEPGMFRADPPDEAKRKAPPTGEEMEENSNEMLTPADPSLNTVWSASAGPASDILF